VAELGSYAAGVHHLEKPAAVLDSELPTGVAVVLRRFNGGQLFHEALTIHRGSDLRWTDDRIEVASLGGDEISVARDGRVYRAELGSGDVVPDGQSFERWLSGFVDAESVIFDKQGEFRDEIFDEDGELLSVAAIEHERRWLKRDKSATGVRWRLSRALSRAGQLESARDELERAVEDGGFPWAWYDLARISEALGEVESARDEVAAAIDCDPQHPHAGFFLAHAARLAVDEQTRTSLAARALRLDPDLARSQRDGCRELLDLGELKAARELAEVAIALTPRDLELLDLIKRLDAAE
jgi:tetratricopeptide (TPR) repeat protein